MKLKTPKGNLASFTKPNLKFDSVRKIHQHVRSLNPYRTSRITDSVCKFVLLYVI
jgi:hypothetical protein